MILSRTFFIRATSPRLVILRASDEVRCQDSGGVHRAPKTGDARRISTYRIVSEFSTFPGSKWEGKQ
jgi:hypothetical protein